MADRATRHEQDRDDWFAGGEPARENLETDQRRLADEGSEPADDWVSGDASVDREAPEARLALFRVRVGLAIAVLVVAVLIGLAVAGVFGGGSGPATTATTSPQTTTTPTPTSSTPGQTTAASVAAPKTTLKPGDSGAQVKVLQRALARLGYAPGKVDGDYGSATKQAVARFQKAAGLTSDGIVGAQTLRALTRRLGNP